ncbi:MAG: hypothetical protein ACLPQ6_08325 [Steroidobacteraceae bacterium]|jgi:hypothetical protein
MSSRARRVLALTGVVTLHAGALLMLLAETRTRLVPTATATPALLVLLLSALEPQREQPRSGRSAPSRSGRAAGAPLGPEAPAAGISTAPRAAVDWLAEASDAASRQVEDNEQRARQARALAPPSSMFAPPPPKRPGFHWSYARTHRVEPVPGLGTIIHLNDQCALLLFVIIPMIGCALEKAPVRGDLFEHMHDPGDEGPSP